MVEGKILAFRLDERDGVYKASEQLFPPDWSTFHFLFRQKGKAVEHGHMVINLCGECAMQVAEFIGLDMNVEAMNARCPSCDCSMGEHYSWCGRGVVADAK